MDTNTDCNYKRLELASYNRMKRQSMAGQMGKSSLRSNMYLDLLDGSYK